jgi:hypothetical protein
MAAHQDLSLIVCASCAGPAVGEPARPACRDRPQPNSGVTIMATAGQFTKGQFQLVIDGHAMAQFSELQGISTKVEPIDPASRGSVAPVTLVLRRAKTDDAQLIAWHRSGMKKNGTLATSGAAGTARYRLKNAAATQYGGVTKIDSFTWKQGVAPAQVEEITIVVERIDRF